MTTRLIERFEAALLRAETALNSGDLKACEAALSIAEWRLTELDSPDALESRWTDLQRPPGGRTRTQATLIIVATELADSLGLDMAKKTAKPLSDDEKRQEAQLQLRQDAETALKWAIRHADSKHAELTPAWHAAMNAYLEKHLSGWPLAHAKELFESDPRDAIASSY